MTSARANIFAIPLEGGTTPEVLLAASAAPRPFWIVTANAEILLAAHEDPAYAAVLRQASWRTVDGSGPQMILALQKTPVTRLSGVDLAEEVLAEAARQQWKVAFFGGEPTVTKSVVAYWQACFPALDATAWSGGVVTSHGEEDEATTRDRLALEAAKPDLILVALGGGKKCEIWIAQYVARWSFARFVIGVGGAFDMWAGRLPRAPKLFRVLGMEWMWRLLLQPTRWRRIWRAVCVFPWRVWRAR